MLGRAGRPQYDTCGTAVIMTKASLKAHYEAQGLSVLESSLLRSGLAEHINAELSLGAVASADGCLAWARETLLCVRLAKNPAHYGIRAWRAPLVFIQKKANKGPLSQLWALSCCSEFSDVQLRNNEKAALNALNGSRRKPGIRFSMSGRVKTTKMKVNCLLQAMLGCMAVTDPSLAQDLPRITVVALRLARALVSMLLLRGPSCGFSALLHAVTLHKCLQARLWEDSPHVARQVDHIGPALSNSLVRAGFTSLDKLASADPRELELAHNDGRPQDHRNSVTLAASLAQVLIKASQITWQLVLVAACTRKHEWKYRMCLQSSARKIFVILLVCRTDAWQGWNKACTSGGTSPFLRAKDSTLA
ncbi:hypothetical protein V5799_025167, partial [Amblyomma americanum]